MERLRAPQFGIGGVLGKGFSVWGRSLVTLVALMVMIYAPLILYQVVRLAGGMASPNPGGFGFTEPAFWIERLLNALSTAAVIYAVFQRLRGEAGGIGESLRVCMSRLLPVLGAAILYFLLTAGPYLLAILVFSVSPPAAIALSLLAAAASIYFSLLLWVTIPAVVVEGLRPVAALKRSAVLTRGVKGQIFVINLVVGVIVGVGGVVAYFVAGSAAGSIIGQLVVIVVMGALTATVTAVGYHDLRRAKEGIGVEELLKVFA